MPRLGITCGDPAGVGPEIIAAWLRGLRSPSGKFFIIGPARWLATLPQRPNVRLVPVGPADFAATPGKPTEDGARVALAAMETAAQGARDGRWDAVVTGPVSKAELARVGFKHPGQTEFFASHWGGEPVMAFVGDKLRVALATWHVPLEDVPQALGPAAITRAVEAAARISGRPVRAARIAVCGLNPHAGEGGLLGHDERDRIDPLLAKLRRKFPKLSRCLPGDTVFVRALRGEFDAVVAMYHDQALAPLKAVEFDSAVNVTLGLPFVRTSPDHGTAFDIAGRGKARPDSFIAAVRVALRLSHHISAAERQRLLG
jgi:4-hydroxythreonine-4-phosphate dehydrogenase